MMPLHLSALLLRRHTPSNTLFKTAEDQVVLTSMELFKADIGTTLLI